MILLPGTHILRRDNEVNRPLVVDYASVSANIPTELSVWSYPYNELIEKVYVGTYSPHTWWINNPLLGNKELGPGEEILISVGEGAIFRIESNLIYVAQSNH